MTVNGVSVRPPKAYGGNGLAFDRAGLFLVLLSQLGLTVLWDGGEACQEAPCSISRQAGAPHGLDPKPSLKRLTQLGPHKSPLLWVSSVSEEHLRVVHSAFTQHTTPAGWLGLLSASRLAAACTKPCLD